ncbi:MAG: carbohydrate ABC transporter permease [Chloroflexi bacterium]|nr:carbohydrate ABC transporter permease [Chloroflexota bacterium]
MTAATPPRATLREAPATVGHLRRARLRPGLIFKYLYLCLFSLFFLFPIYWMLINAFKLPRDILIYPPVWVPSELTLENFDVAVTRYAGLRALTNSLVAAGGSTVLALVVGTLAGYSMARFNTGGRQLSFWLLTQRMIPAVSLIFPSFLLFKEIGWIDTPQALIALYAVAALPFTVWMTRGYIVEIPHEVEESALVDGCNRLQVLWRITLPLAAPGLAATAIFVFVFGWTEFLFAAILARTEMMTLPVVISSFYGTQASIYGVASALALMAMVPVFILALAMQRHLVRGLTLGAVKG